MEMGSYALLAFSSDRCVRKEQNETLRRLTIATVRILTSW